MSIWRWLCQCPGLKRMSDEWLAGRDFAIGDKVQVSQNHSNHSPLEPGSPS